jgi:flavorubredoxin
MRPVQIAESAHWVGALDPQIRIFDVIMHAPRGTTYNSYLIQGAEKTALIELVKGPFADDLFQNVREVLPDTKLDYIVLNHTEPDHAGALSAALELFPNAKVVCSRGAKLLTQQLLNADCNPQVVGDGDAIDLGGRTLQFISAPFLHWPDTMFTYVPEIEGLFPCDFLGAHYCDDRLFNDRVPDYQTEFKYYFDIIMRPFKEYALKALDKIAPLDIELIGPSHGPVLRANVSQYLSAYREWASQPKAGDSKHLLVFYASSYGNTAKMAEQIAAGIQEAGARVSIFDLAGTEVPKLVDEIEAADGIVVGSLTINGDAVKPVWDLLSSLATLKLKGKLGAAFGSYAWSGEAPQLIADRLGGLKFKLPEPPLKVQFVPTEADLAECKEYGKRLAGAV